MPRAKLIAMYLPGNIVSIWKHCQINNSQILVSTRCAFSCNCLDRIRDQYSYQWCVFYSHWLYFELFIIRLWFKECSFINYSSTLYTQQITCVTLILPLLGVHCEGNNTISRYNMHKLANYTDVLHGYISWKPLTNVYIFLFLWSANSA